MTTFIPNSEKPRTEPQKVFVYGTLKKGYGNHERLLSNCRMLGQGQLEGIMFHLGGFPAISLSELYTRIIGEVYQVTQEDLNALDNLEGVPYLYQRVEVALFPYKTVWTYVFNRERAGKEKWIIPSGIWRGSDTPKVEWGGWGRGALVGQFQTNRESSSILVGSEGKQNFELRKTMNGTYNLIRIDTGEVLGNYRHLGDMVGKDGVTKPILRLPAKSVVEEVKETIYQQAAGTASNYSAPSRQQIIDHPAVPYVVETPKKYHESQTARLLGLKVKEA